jgi:hypothetical protein
MLWQLAKSSNCKFGKMEANIMMISSLNHELPAKERDFNRGYTPKKTKESESSSLLLPILFILISLSEVQFLTSAHKADFVTILHSLRFIDTKLSRSRDN